MNSISSELETLFYDDSISVKVTEEEHYSMYIQQRRKDMFDGWHDSIAETNLDVDIPSQSFLWVGGWTDRPLWSIHFHRLFIVHFFYFTCCILF